MNWLNEPFSIGIWEVFLDLTVAVPGGCLNCILCSGILQVGFPPRIGALLTINIIFEGQFFVGGLVVKIPAFG